jgi:hypothetical protein
MGENYSGNIHYYVNDIGNLFFERSRIYVFPENLKILSKDEFKNALEYLFPDTNIEAFSKDDIEELTGLIYNERSISICMDDACEICNPKQYRYQNKVKYST